MSRSTWTKQIIDNHVSNILKQVKDEKERRIRGFQFAKMYFDAKEYELAKRYLQGFMSVKDNSAPAYKLLGQIMEVQNQMQQAIDAYKRCLELDPQQNQVLLKVCELYCESVSVSPDVARFWAEKAEKVYPGNEVVFNLLLKSRENGKAGNEQQDLLDLLIAESDKYPWDVTRQTRLLNQYKVAGRVSDAYDRAIKVDPTRHSTFLRSLEWHQCVFDIMTLYKNQQGANVTSQFRQHYLTLLNDLLLLSMEKSPVNDVVNILWSFDQSLSNEQNINVQREDWKVFRSEMEAQFFFHCGTVLLNKALKDRLSWREACELAAACYMASFSVSPFTNKAAWFARAKDYDQKVYMEWYKVANYRCSQAGHMLLNLASVGSERSWMERVQRDFCCQQGKDRLFQVLFTLPQQRNGYERSYIAQSTLYENFTPRFPDRSEMKEIDNVSQQSRADSLHHAIWICIQYYTSRSKTQPNYGLPLFGALPYETTNLDIVGSDSVKQLDVEAFLYAVVRSAALKQDEKRRLIDNNRPSILPASIDESFCSAEQQQWWTSVFKLTSNTARESLGQLRTVLQRGLETIRSISNNSLDVDMLVHLARTFSDRVDETRSRALAPEDFANEITSLQMRSLHYWKKAVERLEQLKKKNLPRPAKYSLFENHDEQLSEKDILAYLDEGHLFLAKDAKKKGKFEEALSLLSHMQTAEASFETALIYKLLGTEHQSCDVGCDDTERDHYIMLLSRAKDALYSTLDRIRGDRFHDLNGLVADEMDIIETCLNRLFNIQNDLDDMLDEPNVSSVGVSRLMSPDKKTVVRTPDKRQQLSVTNGLERGGHIAQSTPQMRASASSPVNVSQRCRPSPDRLDAEMRSIRFVQDNFLRALSEDQKSVKNLLEHVQILVHQSAERLTNVETKLALVLEFQRQMTLNSFQTRPASQQPHPIQTRVGLIQPAYPGAPFAADVSYDYLAGVQSYESSMYYGAGVQPPAQPSSQTGTGFPPFGSATHSYVVPLTELSQQAEQFNYGGEYGYNDDDYQENALGYEISDESSLPRLASHDVFMSGDESLSRPPPIMPGFFANQVKQKLDEKFAIADNSRASSQTAVTSIVPSSTTSVSQTSAEVAASSKFVSISQPSPATSTPQSTTTVKTVFGGFSVPVTTAATSVLQPTSTVKTVFGGSPAVTKTPVTTGSLPSSTVKTIFGGSPATITTPVIVGSKATSTANSILGSFSGTSTASQSTSETKTIFGGFKAAFSTPVAVMSQSTSAAKPIFSGFSAVATTAAAPASQPSTTASAPKAVFGGFTFTSTPVVTDVKSDPKGSKKVDADKEEAKVANPFAGFSFNKSSQPTAEDEKESQSTSVFGSFKFTSPPSVAKSAAKDQQSVAVTATPSTQPIFGSSIVSATPNFATLAAQTEPAKQPTSAMKTDNVGAFQGAGQQLFKGSAKTTSSAGRSRTESKTGEDEEEGVGDDYVPDQEFKPLVSLPEVEVKTGEEDEEKLFGERAKLYRMDPESKTWKERGLGEMKILHHKENGKCRILMRREQVLKLCANHLITASMKLVPLATSETSLCWVANDYSEGECSSEQLCVKFKTVDQFNKFRSCFESCQSSIDKTAGVKSADKPSQIVSAAKSETNVSNTTAQTTKSLSSLFQAKAGQWDCTGCYIRNEGSTTNCVACSTLKVGVTPEASSNASVVSQSKNTPTSDTSNIAPLSSLFQAKAGQWDCSGCYIRNDATKVKCVACDTPNPAAKSTPAVTAQNANTPATESSFKIGAAGGFTFGTTAPFKFTGFGSNSASSSVTTVVTETASATKPLFTAPLSQGITASSSGGVLSLSQPAPTFTFKPLQTSATTVSNKSAAPVFALSSTTISKPTTKPSDASVSSNTPSFAETVTTKSADSNVPVSSSKEGFGTHGFVFKGVAPSSSQGSLVSFSSLQSLSTPTKKTEEAPASPSSPELYVTRDDDEPNVTFEPVCTLPDNVEVKTGEEDEDVLYEHRAKLYRFSDSEWKERGIGDVKLLRHRETGVIRIVMRRERVLKICMNHRIVASLNLQPMPSSQGKAWMWYAVDFADGPEPTNENFSLRFKNEEIADSFKKAFDDAKQQVIQSSGSQSQHNLAKTGSSASRSILAGLLTSASKDTALDLSSSSDKSDKRPQSVVNDGGVSRECEIVRVEMPPSDLVQLAVKYQLPETFFNYLTKPDCPGCIGCQSEDFNFSETAASSIGITKSPLLKPAQLSTTSLNRPLPPVFGESQPVFGSASHVQSTVATSKQSIFGSGSSSSGLQPDFGSLTPASLPVFGSTNSVSQPVFGSSSSTRAPVFGSASATPVAPVHSNAGDAPTLPVLSSSIAAASVVGSVSTTPAAPVFGSVSFSRTAPIFGSASSVEPTSQQSLFGNTSKSLGFEELAAGAKPTAFGGKSGDSSFSWTGSGTPLFSKITPKKADARNADDEDDSADENVDNDEGDHIHFEPIVQLPECVDLKTGEEDEEEMFRQRAKLYRFEVSEWKERGVGEMKIMKNKSSGRYRLLLRREQVHKVACNHLLTIDMQLQPLQTSETAWCWYAYDYSDDEPRMDKFAVRFKNIELAKQFSEVFVRCQQDLGNNSFKVESTQAHDEEQVPAADADAETVLFYKRATVSVVDNITQKQVKSMVEMKIYPAQKDKGRGARFLLKKDQGDDVLDHLISSEDRLKRLTKKPPVCELIVSNQPTKTFHINLSSNGAADELEKLFQQLASSS